jgi:N-acylneuraminate cytidylyltransferase
LITARGGSKRIPGKNIRSLGTRPLIAWSVDVAANIPEICDILVSTDDMAIADVARKAGASVPWLRPAELATDTASSEEVCLHALDRYESENGPVDGLLLLQPTSPFRSRETVLRGLDLFRRHNFRPVLGVAPARSHPMWCFRIVDDSLRPFIEGPGLRLRSQDLPPAFVINGALYLVAPRDLRRLRSFLSDETVPLVIERQQESIDIDSEWDWQLAEAVVGLRSEVSR